jgi:hypothetical protein
MSFVLIIHEVENYPTWKLAFDKAINIRKAAGEISFQLFQYEKSDNWIIHLSCWTSLENAKLFFESQEVALIRKEAGVKSPSFIYLNQIEEGVL